MNNGLKLVLVGFGVIGLSSSMFSAAIQSSAHREQSHCMRNETEASLTKKGYDLVPATEPFEVIKETEWPQWGENSARTFKGTFYYVNKRLFNCEPGDKASCMRQESDSYDQVYLIPVRLVHQAVKVANAYYSKGTSVPERRYDLPDVLKNAALEDVIVVSSVVTSVVTKKHDVKHEKKHPTIVVRSAEYAWAPVLPSDYHGAPRRYEVMNPKKLNQCLFKVTTASKTDLK